MPSELLISADESEERNQSQFKMLIYLEKIHKFILGVCYYKNRKCTSMDGFYECKLFDVILS